MRSFTKGRVLKVFASLLIILTVLECGLRLSGRWRTFSEKSTGEFWFEWGAERASPFYTYLPNDTFPMNIGEFKWEYTTNSLGFREREIDTLGTDSSQAGGIRLFVFGDSFAEGNGAGRDSSWPRVLENLIREDGRSADVYVCGISGSDPFYGYALLREKLYRYAPTHVIFSVNDSDFNEFLFRGGFSRFKGDGRVVYNAPPSFLQLYRRSHLVRLYVHTFKKYDVYLIRRNDRTERSEMVADSIENCLARTYEFCGENGIKFLAVIHPLPHTFCYKGRSPEKGIRDLEEARTIPVTGLYSGLEKAMTAGSGEDCFRYCWRIDSHFNNKGYELMARLIYEDTGRHHADFWETP